jgi:hypothetical protein
MNTPHIDKLHYRIIPNININYDNAPPVETENNNFVLFIENKIAIFKMKRKRQFFPP